MTLDTQETAIVSPNGGLSWGAVLGGAIVATAMAIMLIALGSGLGLAWVSPFSDTNPSGLTFTVVTAIWLIVVQWISSFFGGYLTGRLHRATVESARRDVEFRDAAAGFVAWAVSVLLVVGVAGSSMGLALEGVGKHATASLGRMGGEALSHPGSGPEEYLIDTLFRGTTPDTSNPQEARSEVARILATAATGQISPADHQYLTQMVASRVGISEQEATGRVDQAIAAEKDSLAKAAHIVDLTRKAASSFALYTFFSMLVGAFIACVAGAVGGRQRDSLYAATEALRR
ncbi:hypothetical protein K2X14_09325 [Acetobacter sp. TBRC 12305]|uniref:Mll5186 protein n=1 Tax=Acetobacter garciniae TaxID=2817435 RepID=A0A939HRR3_9PROT|nr:hypothetical protein [Acetobacter garciniae]MBO1326671.1 hypothetical protein [Acetobacter garciniae]MBX0345034.1 hypothetical protein [Acetobacter garciniae]